MVAKAKKPKNAARKRVKQAPPRARRTRMPMGMSVLSDPRAAAWDRLLRDPCAANLTAPCYVGIDSGYLLRTVDILQVGGAAPTGTVGASTTLDSCLVITPFNASPTTGVLGSGIAGGGAMPVFGNGGLNNMIVSNTVVSRYRPIAACAKWIPTGPYTNRQGSVGLGYSPGQPFLAGSAISINTAIVETQRICPNGSEVHEVRWLPTAVDENFTDIVANNNTAAGTMIIALRGVDAVYNTTTNANANGYVDLTVVWEWVPARSQGTAPAPRAPLPYTSQQVLSTIGDMGAYLFQGIRAAGPGLVTAAARAGVKYLTGGVGEQVTRGPAMLTRF